MKIILDTNILVYAAKKKKDLIGQLKEQYGAGAEILIPNLVMQELEKLAESARKASDKRAAKLALQIIKFSGLKVVDIGEGHADTHIIEWAKANNAIVGTYDKELKQKLKKAEILIL